MQEGDLRVVFGHPVAVLADAADQHAREQEVRKDHDPPVAQLHHGPQSRFNQREGDPGVERFAPAEAETFHQHPRHLGDIGVRVGVGGSPSHHHQQRFGYRDRGKPLVVPTPVVLLQDGADAGSRGQDHAPVDPQFPAVVDAQSRFGGVGVEHRRNVVLRVAGREQHRRYRQHMLDSAEAQGIETIAQDRPGEFQIAVLQRHRREIPAQGLGQAGEFGHGQPVPAAMAADQNADAAVGSCRGEGGSHGGAHLGRPYSRPVAGSARTSRFPPPRRRPPGDARMSS